MNGMKASRIAILGLGLIGGSLARALRASDYSHQIAAYDTDRNALKHALDENVIDEAAVLPAEAVRNADLVILACPPLACERLLTEIAPHLSGDTVLMDTLSVKAPVAGWCENLRIHTMIPAHPIAGRAEGGFTSSRADLFRGRRVILTPREALPPFLLHQAESFWMSLGAMPETMDAQAHDRIYALVSHLPHLLCYAAVDIMQNQTSHHSRFLRIAGSPPGLWRDIALLNADNILSALETYRTVLSHIIHELAQGPADSTVSKTVSELTLFPRIAASCLISAVALTERKGISVARYAGTGFQDFISPAETPPEQDMESISEQFAALLHPLQAYNAALERMERALRDKNADALKNLFANAQEMHLASHRTPDA